MPRGTRPARRRRELSTPVLALFRKTKIRAFAWSPTRSQTLLALALGTSVLSGEVVAADLEIRVLFDDFSPAWRAPWREQSLFAKPTRYAVVLDDGRPVLQAVSASANAALVREIAVPAPSEGRLRWRWKVRNSLAGNFRERERAGDDYAARVFVVFETSFFPLRTRAINYVWASTEKPGSVFASPYTKNVGILVLRSGDAASGQWQAENRDVLADYGAFFGEAPRRISAVAVLTDTDNTGSEAEAWFADLILETRPENAAARRR